MNVNKYWEKGQEWAPLCVVIGADPLYYLCSQMSQPAQVDEWDSWGAITGEPMEVVKAETCDILVPANAEIVLEGELSKTERILEGPFSEFTGFYSGCRWVSAFRINAITMRREPIYQYLKMGKEPNEGLNFTTYMIETQLYKQLKAFIPEISGVHCITGIGVTTIVSVPKKARIEKPGLVNAIGMAVKTVKGGHWTKNLIVVDDDVDIESHHDLFWAFSMRFQGERDITVIPNITGADLDPSEASLGKGPGHTSYTIFDCTEPLYPYDEAYRRGLAKPAADEIVKRVAEKWTDYGF
jgi:UbiD family decarboxylase